MGFGDFIGNLFGGGDAGGIPGLGGGIPLENGQIPDSGGGGGFLGDLFGGSSSGGGIGGTLLDLGGKVLSNPGTFQGLGGIGQALLSQDMEDAKIQQIKETLELERNKLAFQQAKAGFDSELQKKQLEIELALAAIEKQQAAAPDRTQEIQARQAAISQGAQDTSRTMQALNNIVAGFQSGIK